MTRPFEAAYGAYLDARRWLYTAVTRAAQEVAVVWPGDFDEQNIEKERS